MTVGRRVGAEAVGTAFLLATVVGSGIMAERLAAGNTALALLANSTATAAVLAPLIVVFAPISGAHFNPWVSLLMARRQAISAGEAARYMAAQMAGAAVGVFLAHAMFDLPMVSVSSHARHSLGQGIAEAVATFGLLLVIGLASRFRPTAVPATVAAYVAGAYWFTSSTAFANPAVTLARSLTNTFAGIRLSDVPVFLFGQAFGFVAAMVLLEWWAPARQQELL